jgi:hypothetical protein
MFELPYRIGNKVIVAVLELVFIVRNLGIGSRVGIRRSGGMRQV